LGLALAIGALLVSGGGLALAQGGPRIGVLTPLSPPGDPGAGALIVRGARLGEEYVNTVLGGVKGKKIEILVEDDSGTPEKGVAGYRKLVSQDGVVAVIGQFHSSVALAVQKLAEQMGVPWFATQASAPAITSNKTATSFRTHAIDSDRVTLWMAYIKSKGWKRVAILAENTDYGIGLIEETKQHNKMDNAGLELKDVIFDRTSVDFSAQLLDVKAWKPDLVINIGLPPAGLLIVKQAADIGLFPKTPMLASFDFPVRPEYWKTVGDAGTYISFISYYHPGMKRTALGDWFAKRYQEIHKEPPVYTAFNAFAQIVIVSQALAKTKDGTPAELITALETGSYQSWNGTVTFTRGPVHWHQWAAPMMVLQHQKPNITYDQDPIIYPPELKTGDLIIPK
jgi:branched-chain amino acid transport system substrate-binding protein